MRPSKATSSNWMAIAELRIGWWRAEQDVFDMPSQDVDPAVHPHDHSRSQSPRIGAGVLPTSNYAAGPAERHMRRAARPRPRWSRRQPRCGTVSSAVRSTLGRPAAGKDGQRVFGSTVKSGLRRTQGRVSRGGREFDLVPRAGPRLLHSPQGGCLTPARAGAARRHATPEGSRCRLRCGNDRHPARS
jgi:hypothetical protein